MMGTIEDWELKLYDLHLLEQLYEDKPNNFKLLQVWEAYKNLDFSLPDDLQEAINRYLAAQLKNERSRYIGSNFQRNFKHYKRVKKAGNPAAEMKKIATEEKYVSSIDAIRKRINTIKKLLEK